MSGSRKQTSLYETKACFLRTWLLFHRARNEKKNLKNKIVNDFLSINFNICFECSKEPSH